MRYAVVVRDVEGNEIDRFHRFTRCAAEREAHALNARGKVSAFMVKQAVKTDAEKLADQMFYATVERSWTGAA